MVKKKRQTRKNKKKKAIVVVIPNKPEAPLSHDSDFMDALHDFQYGETAEISESGFQRMIEHGLNKKGESK